MITRVLRPLITLSVTLVPCSPVIRLVASFPRPASERLPTPTIRSPARKPARAAGVPGNTATTRRPLGTANTSMPTPATCGLD